MSDYKDGVSDVLGVTALAPLLRATGTYTGTNLSLEDFNSATFVLVVGAVTDGTFTWSLEECDTSGGYWTAVAAEDINGTIGAQTVNTINQVGYKGTKPWVRAKLVVAAGATGGNTAAILVKGHPKYGPAGSSSTIRIS